MSTHDEKKAITGSRDQNPCETCSEIDHTADDETPEQSACFRCDYNTNDDRVFCEICSEPASVGKYSRGNNPYWLPIRYCHNCGLLKSDGTKADTVSEAIIGQQTFGDLPHGYTPEKRSTPVNKGR